ncbi:MAG TPA: XRE family transcriptional regulator [Trebonia sp.]|jgi:transcriptional regulator with XRE-family HTH domain|nr:XRE family transcriptional regulator [Trebonia sp.]
MANNDAVLSAVGPRLRDLRAGKGLTLADLSASTGISPSTLSRLESGGRKPTLELLLPLARAYDVRLDDLVGVPGPADPRVLGKPVTRHGRTYIPLTQRPGGVRAYKVVLPPAQAAPGPGEQQSHEGHEWMYVLDGRLRLLLGEHDIVLRPGEAAEFDTRTPHAFACADGQPAEVLVLFGPQGEQVHLRARPRRAGSAAQA